jgi:hypothetical protein
MGLSLLSGFGNAMSTGISNYTTIANYTQNSRGKQADSLNTLLGGL